MLAQLNRRTLRRLLIGRSSWAGFHPFRRTHTMRSVTLYNANGQSRMSYSLGARMRHVRSDAVASSIFAWLAPLSNDQPSPLKRFFSSTLNLLRRPNPKPSLCRFRPHQFALMLENHLWRVARSQRHLRQNLSFAHRPTIAAQKSLGHSGPARCSASHPSSGCNFVPRPNSLSMCASP